MTWPQIVMILVLICRLLVVPANDEVYWIWRYSLWTRVLYVSVFAALLWHGGFWG